MPRRICSAVKEIIRELRGQKQIGLDKVVDERTIFRLHMVIHHRSVKEFDREVDLCKVFNVIVDPITWDEVVRIANSSEQI